MSESERMCLVNSLTDTKLGVRLQRALPAHCPQWTPGPTAAPLLR